MNYDKLIKIGAVAGAIAGVVAITWPVLSYSELYPVLAKEYRIAQEDIKDQLEQISKATLI